MHVSDPVNSLRKVGVSVTAQRIAVLNFISSAPHSSADLIAEGVRLEIGTISKQAVYDTLSLLTEKELLRCIQPAKSPALYETRVKDNHHHMICRDCGKTEDVDCAVGSAPCLTASNDAGFIIDEAEVIYWGYCSECHEQ